MRNGHETCMNHEGKSCAPPIWCALKVINMRIIGLDPGLRHTGWGIIEFDGNHLQHVACGHISPPADQALSERLQNLYKNLFHIMERHQPTESAIEETFVNKNPVSTLKLGQARGVVMLAPAQFGLPVMEYAPKAIKQAVVGKGAARKEQIGMMVRTLLPGAAPSSEDAADALAVAICHAHHQSTIQKWRRQAI